MTGAAQPNGRIVINATMLGSVGVGKTSLLAAMYERFGHVVGNVDLDIRPESETSRTLGASVAVLQRIATMNSIRVHVGMEGTGSVRRYRFDIGGKGWPAAFTLQLTDYPGRFMLPAAYADHDVVEQILVDSDVVLVAIDAAAMMEQDGAFHNVTNTPLVVLDEIKRMLAASPEPRLIILTLLKCETYLATPDGTDRLVKKAIEKYRPLLDHIRGTDVRGRVGCVLTSVQTIGSIRLLRVHPDEKGEADFEYRSLGYQGGYKPIDTDQPLRYLLRFAINKYRYEERSRFAAIRDLITGVNSRLAAAVDEFALGCKTTDGFEVLQDHPLLYSSRHGSR
ncbi:TRAFAC clade GTPase domain-containing protein [Hamadaea tsunoensis]|uniref:TRAFAC clade GTPase domain-containing protein n=1 Tax=Hamadaea tsunoensis TaxID=53368 RepID=UPI000407FF90|nr:hypothetical protein [Hamadaea tsunoensis]